jgi:2-polyprenyl-6-methoxyphenol hydroxylase-like FAD-dependent oxidoreductase
MIKVMESRTVAVAIVGGGPVGLMLALFLDRHGVPTVVFNTEPTSRWHPKGNTHNARTMEHYRRLGISKAIRGLGLPAEHPRDVAYFTRLNAWELARIVMPCEAERMRMAVDAAPTDQVPEPLLRANQMYVERYLLEHARSRPNITLRFGWHASSFEQSERGVTVSAERADGTARETWRASFLVGCDGGQSFVRRALGIRYEGQASVEQPFLGGRMISTYVRIPALHRDILGGRKGWLYNVVAPDLRMLLIALDGRDEFLLMTKASHAQALPDDDVIVRTIQRGVGTDIPVTVLAHRPWIGGAALVAERFAIGRVFLAGDATHLFSPTGGFGMNTGIDGVANLSWKLAAVLQGWGGPNLLASYEAERRPVAKRNTAAARFLTERVGEVVVPENVEAHSDAGAAARERLGAFLQSFDRQFASLGVELGGRYDDSPLISRTDGDAPDDDPVTYKPSGVPGGRLPHLWLEGKQGARNSIFDDLGVGFTLLRVGEDAPRADKFRAAAKALRVPFRALTVPRYPARELYERKLVLVRPDQHIAWRSDDPPLDARAVLDRSVGA